MKVNDLLTGGLLVGAMVMGLIIRHDQASSGPLRLLPISLASSGHKGECKITDGVNTCRESTGYIAFGKGVGDKLLLLPDKTIIKIKNTNLYFVPGREYKKLYLKDGWVKSTEVNGIQENF